jgi:hypothetical protein
MYNHPEPPRLDLERNGGPQIRQSVGKIVGVLPNKEFR